MENYMKYGVILLGLLALSAVAISFKPDILGNKSGNVKLPGYAVEVAPGVYSLGTAIHNGKLVEGFAIVDYKEKPAKPSACNHDGVCQKGENPSCDDCGAVQATCYGFLGKGARWKTVEPYEVNPQNTEAMNESAILRIVDGGISKWEDAASADILGAGTAATGPLEADMAAPDGRNEVYFGSIDSANAIAITIVWGTFKGPASGRELVEWDQVYDQADYPWSIAGEPGMMDFENIATHELGHTIGMGDLYTSGCAEETMYGYAGFGETKKQDLGPGDIAGASLLYG
ncbi:hypothetical protein L0Y65_06105 [Candidatus Micrarchaeota archaeon]|nr:hypothetical protein [Candidatus Micrarchaeota archaeon]